MSSAQQDLVDAAINVDQEAVVAPAAETPLNRLNERLIRVVNKCPWSLSFQAESKENDSGWRVLAPGQSRTTSRPGRWWTAPPHAACG